MHEQAASAHEDGAKPASADSSNQQVKKVRPAWAAPAHRKTRPATAGAARRAHARCPRRQAAHAQAARPRVAPPARDEAGPATGTARGYGHRTGRAAMRHGRGPGPLKPPARSWLPKPWQRQAWRPHPPHAASGASGQARARAARPRPGPRPAAGHGQSLGAQTQSALLRLGWCARRMVSWEGLPGVRGRKQRV